MHRNEEVEGEGEREREIPREKEGEKQEEEEEEEEERRQGRRVDGRRRSDGVINDRVFNTLYGLAYKLRAVHRSSWQRINGGEQSTPGLISLFPSPIVSSACLPLRT